MYLYSFCVVVLYIKIGTVTEQIFHVFFTYGLFLRKITVSNQFCLTIFPQLVRFYRTILVSRIGLREIKRKHLSLTVFRALCCKGLNTKSSSRCKLLHLNEHFNIRVMFKYESIGSGLDAGQRSNGRCFDPNFFQMLPSLTRLTDVKEFGTKLYT